MDFLDIALIFSILLCSLVSGFIFTYAIVVMPGLSNLNDKNFLRAFQVTDAVIQKKQSLFMFIWVGSIVSILTTILVSLLSIGLSKAWPIVLIGIVYLLVIQGITITIHIPLNNHIQNIKIEKLNEKLIADKRINFEKRWNFFNYIRTAVAISTSFSLLIILSLR
jgi:uncharacterized membrane protein